jgi:hypothetical protein
MVSLAKSIICMLSHIDACNVIEYIHISSLYKVKLLFMCC